MEQIETEEVVEPRIYEIYKTNGAKIVVTGFLGVNDVFMAVADDKNRLVFASPLGNIDYAMAVVEVPTSKSIN